VGKEQKLYLGGEILITSWRSAITFGSEAGEKEEESLELNEETKA